MNEPNTTVMIRAMTKGERLVMVALATLLGGIYTIFCIFGVSFFLFAMAYLMAGDGPSRFGDTFWSVAFIYAPLGFGIIMAITATFSFRRAFRNNRLAWLLLPLVNIVLFFVIVRSILSILV